MDDVSFFKGDTMIEVRFRPPASMKTFSSTVGLRSFSQFWKRRQSSPQGNDNLYCAEKAEGPI